MEALKRVEAGLPVPDLCREVGISTATFYKWRAKFGGMDTSMMARMKELEEENRRLKKMYIEEKLKAEIAAEYLAKKLVGRLADARWPKRWLSVEGWPSGWPVRSSRSASLASAMRARRTPRTS
jgi:putative transposase